MYCLLSGFGGSKISIVVFVAILTTAAFGNSAPALQGVYSKLIGRGNAGLYFSVLQSNGAMSRVLSGQLVGWAYGTLGPASFWWSVHVVWLAQIGAFLSMYARLTPEAIGAMHQKLGVPGGAARTSGLRAPLLGDSSAAAATADSRGVAPRWLVRTCFGAAVRAGA